MGTYTGSILWLVEQHVKGKAEGEYKQEGEDDHPHEGVEDVQEHHNIDACERELLHKDNQVDPSKEDRNDANLPLPVIWTEAVSVEDPHKHYGAGEGEDFKKIDPVFNVFKSTKEELVGLHQQSHQCQEHDDNGSNEEEPVVSSSPALVVHKLCMGRTQNHTDDWDGTLLTQDGKSTQLLDCDCIHLRISGRVSIAKCIMNHFAV